MCSSDLEDFHRRHGRPLPQFEILAAEAVPEPERSLLVHDRDMTRTLERHHGDTIHLRVLSRFHEGDVYGRESILQLDRSDRPVEYGAIRIHLDRARRSGLHLQAQLLKLAEIVSD